MDKKFFIRFEKDLQGINTTLILLGIIIEGGKMWTHQIKSRFEELSESSYILPTSTLYATLNKLEFQYNVIYSDYDDEVKRKYYSPTQTGFDNYKYVKNYFFDFYEQFTSTLNKLNIKKEN